MVKNPPANAGDARDPGLIPGSERSPGGGNGTPLQYSCLENPMDRGAWQATVQGVTKSWARLGPHMHVTSLPEPWGKSGVFRQRKVREELSTCSLEMGTDCSFLVQDSLRLGPFPLQPPSTALSCRSSARDTLGSDHIPRSGEDSSLPSGSFCLGDITPLGLQGTAAHLPVRPQQML